MATDVGKKLGYFKYFHYGGMLKTIAGKMGSSVNNIVRVHGVLVPKKRGLGFKRLVGVEYNTCTGRRTLMYFDKSLSRVEYPLTGVGDWFGEPLAGKQLVARFRANKCELCGSVEDIVVHHVRKLRALKQKYVQSKGEALPLWVMTMLKSHRRTLVVCYSCHLGIHASVV